MKFFSGHRLKLSCGRIFLCRHMSFIQFTFHMALKVKMYNFKVLQDYFEIIFLIVITSGNPILLELNGG